MGPRPHLSFCVFKTATLASELHDSMGPRPHLWFVAFKTATLAPELQVSMGPSPHLWFCAFTTAPLGPELQVSMDPSLYGSQTSPMGFCFQNSVISIRISSLYGSQPSFVVCAFTTEILWPDLIVSMDSTPHLSFCAYKTVCLESELQVSIGPSTQLCILFPKQRLLDPNYKSLWGQLPIGPSLHLWCCAFKTASLAAELLVSMGPRLRLLIWECKTACLDPEWR